METSEIIEAIGDSAAYPMNFEYSSENNQGIPSINTKTAFGLSKREYYSALALPVILKFAFDNGLGKGMFQSVANDAVTAADALIEALDKRRRDKEFLQELENT